MPSSDIPIHRIPCVHPRTSVAGCGLPSANAHTNNDVYTQEWKKDVHFRRVNAVDGRIVAGVIAPSETFVALEEICVRRRPPAASLRQPARHPAQALPGLGRPLVDFAR